MRWHIAVLIVVAAAGLTAIFVQSFLGFDDRHSASAQTLNPITAKVVPHDWAFVPPSLYSETGSD